MNELINFLATNQTLICTCHVDAFMMSNQQLVYKRYLFFTHIRAIYATSYECSTTHEKIGLWEM